MKLFSFLLAFCFLTQAYGQEIDEHMPPVPGLPYVSLEDAGFNRDSIARLLQDIGDIPTRDFRGLVLVKDNQVVIEYYDNTFWRNTILDIRSAGKSITAILLGVAMQEGLVDNLDQSVYSFFPKGKYPFISEDYKKITLQHCLNMASGLDADSDYSETPGNAFNWIAKDNWKDYILQVSAASEPGEKWVYADINAVLISLIIEETSGKSLKDFAQEKLFDPLGIQQVYWYTNASQQTGGAGNLYLTTLDFAKLGVVVANEGKWGDQQLMDEVYTKQLQQSQNIELPEGYSFGDTYGELWYKAQRTFGNKKINYLYASGNGGNYLIIVPDKEIVVAVTNSAYGQGYGHGRARTIFRRLMTAME
ncbi:MAG: serine hydrolase domain-containing protein [Saprospiraceae bacterium]